MQGWSPAYHAPSPIYIDTAGMDTYFLMGIPFICLSSCYQCGQMDIMSPPFSFGLVIADVDTSPPGLV